MQVKITLSPGLSFASSNLSDTTISGNTATWRVGDLPAAYRDASRTRTLDIPVQLSGSAPLERRCLTAEVVQVTPPDSEDERYDDIAVACLGDGPPERFSSGIFLDLFTFFPCIGVTTYPCSTDDTLEIVTKAYLSVQDTPLRQRRRDSAPAPESYVTGQVYLQPESVTIHVDDRSGRGMDDGSVIWSTEGLMRLRDSQAHLTSSWRVQEHVTVTAPGGGDAPGRWVMALDTGGHDLVDVLEAPDSSKVNGLAFDLSEIGSDPSDYLVDTVIQFGALGTYKALFEITGTLSGTTYTDGGTYTFHVGPLAELELRDAGASPKIAGWEGAYTIEAVNNGPDAAAAVEVTVTGVPEGARVVGTQGDYREAFCGENGLCEGVWTVGGLAAPETAPLSGRSASATLTIIADGDPITATIESARDYTVCIDDNGVDVAASSRSACEAGSNSWHSAEYYDHVTYNNERQFTSRPGAGRHGHPEAPTSLRVEKFGPLALLRWDPVERVNGLPVTHYQVERNGAMLADDVKGYIYADMQGGAVNQSYRVRAVNELGVPGPWSLPSAWAIDTPAAPNGLGLTATPGRGDAGRIDLSWFAPSGETGLSYHIEYAFDGDGPWTRLRTQSGTTYSHTGLLLGVTYHYRVAAVRGNVVISPWGHVQATTEGVSVDTPGWPENLRFTSIDRTAVTLAWDPPPDDGGSRVTGYEYRVFGPCASGADAVCDIVAPTRVSGTSRRIAGLNREGTYEFSVRALNAVGAGDWSQPIQKDVGPATAGGGRVILSPSRLTVPEGGEATYRVKLSTSPTLPLFVTLHWDGTGDENLGGELAVQQFKILLPSGYDTSGLPEWCDGIRLDWNEAYAWNAGVPITVVATEDDDSEHESLTILHDVYTLSAECLNMEAGDWAPDPVYDGLQGPALTVTERDND